MKPSTPKGTKDFLPKELSKRNYVIDVLKKNFEAYGFEEINTPSLENNSTLLGKYGDEGDRLIFRVLNSGDKIKKADLESFQKKDFTKFVSSLSNKGLRYDLTVPLARFVSQHQNEIIFPFKRYQIQNVWRADRPQKGRFQEFTQCDVDVVGSKSIIQEIELLNLYDSVFNELGLNDIVIKINHRSILISVAKYFGFNDQSINDFITVIDKIEKIGVESAYKELCFRKKNLSKKIFHDFFDNELISLETLKPILRNIENFEEGSFEIKQILDFFSKKNTLKNKLVFDLKLARGLNYYTGLIVEVITQTNDFGSIGGGGRYDNLISLSKFKNVSGIGISFGLDRICIEMERQNLFPDQSKNKNILIVNFGLKFLTKLYPLINSLRKHDFNVDIYQEENKLNKQLSYANKHGIACVLIMGENESKTNSVLVKNMKTGLQYSKEITDIDIKNFFEL
tara:strand:+ start:992 stop:2350 length:1359 start_codon:yes stop_codon:yes gene_type:complete